MNKKLATHVLPSDVENYPEFTKLLGFISKNLDENGISKAVNKDLLEVNTLIVYFTRAKNAISLCYVAVMISVK